MAADGMKYDSVISERLGRSSSKEQYAYLYRYVGSKVTCCDIDQCVFLIMLMFRPDRVKLETYQFDDPDDVFERAPYGVHVSPVNRGKYVIPALTLANP